MRNRKNLIGLLVVLIVAGVGLLTAMTWGNYQYAQQNPGGKDFLIQWVSARSLLVDGISPYSDTTANRIQDLYYGRHAQPNEDQLRMAYPIYTTVIFIPFALIGDFSLARAFWMTILEIGLILMGFITLKVIEWKSNLISLVFFFLFTVLWFHAIQPLLDGNVIILVTLLMVGAFLAIRSGADELAGGLLALSTIKPQVVVLVILFIVLWGVINRRWRLLAWLLGMQIVLLAFGFFLLPDWLLQNIREVVGYAGSHPISTPGTALAAWFPALGERLGWILTGMVGILLIMEWFRARKAEFRGFLWAVCLTLVLTLWSGIPTSPENLIVTYPGIILISALLDERWRKGGWIAGLVVLLGLLVGIWWLFYITGMSLDVPTAYAIFFFPLPLVLLILMYWVRWWAFHPIHTWYELMRDKEN